MAGYVTPDQIREATGVRFEDFRLADADELDALLDRWIEYVSGLIDDHAGVDFLDEAGDVVDEVHPTIRGVAERAVSRWVQQVRSHRDAATIRLDEWQVGINLVDEVLPQHMRDDIDRHMANRRRDNSPLGFRGFVAHGAEDD